MCICIKEVSISSAEEVSFEWYKHHTISCTDFKVKVTNNQPRSVRRVGENPGNEVDK